MSKSSLIKGTAVLTLAGIITRIIGFFYRIYLSRAMAAEQLGVYQLIFPVYGICFTIFASGIQTSLSRLIAAELGNKGYKNIPKLLRVGVTMSVSCALFLTGLVHIFSEPIASNILMEPSCAESIRILSYTFPFCGITACINGYYYGLKKAGVPASTQLFEQIVRVISVYIFAIYFGKGDGKITTELAVLGIVMGEIASCLYNIGSLKYAPSQRKFNKFVRNYPAPNGRLKKAARGILNMSIPLTGNRLLISVLHSVEAILIPNMLKKSGLSNTEALSIFGIINGMSMPFIMFPSAITNSLAVLLLPTISEAQATNNTKMIKKTTALSIKYSLLIGILSTGIFVTFGRDLGKTIFHNELSGSFLMILAWLCPFLYINTTLSSIINGLGLAHLTFINSVIGLSVRILFIINIVPKSGIKGYLISLLISQLVIVAFDLIIVIRNIKPRFQAIDWILKPGLIIALSSYNLYQIYHYISIRHGGVGLVLGFCLILSATYIILLGITKAVSLKEFK